jgi:ABC-type Fe3+-hydroxamate transport system substrate-binding protein
MICVRDDAGRTVTLAARPRRIVSLVPSLTETLFALGCGEAVVGVTRHCEEPAAQVAEKTQVGGTKNPDCETIRRLEPDVVIVNAEENRRADFARLEELGLRTFVTFPRSLDDAVDLLRRLGQLIGCAERGEELASELAAAIAEVRGKVRHRRRVFCPIWKNPWMTIGARTYVDDVVWTAGGVNIFRDASVPYPTVTLAEAAEREPEVVLLPDEPYRFSPRDLADLEPLRETPAGRHGQVYLVDGKALSWYGSRAAAGVNAVASVLCRESLGGRSS